MSELEGRTIIDKAIMPPLRGKIVRVNSDGTVLVAWKPGQVTRITPERGRYDVEMPPTPRTP